MYILSISGHHHDATATLLKDGKVIAAIEEEKLVRVKHVGIDQCGGLPYEAIGYCLEAAAIRVEDLDYVTYYLKPRRLLRRQHSFNKLLANAPEFASYHIASDNEYRNRLRTQHLIKRLLAQSSKVIPVDHQLAHAASSFYLSGFEGISSPSPPGLAKGERFAFWIGLSSQLPWVGSTV
jgi:carbamoyltransferase